jgi:protein TonB
MAFQSRASDAFFGMPRSRSLTGMSIVVMLHVALGYALLNGMARRAIEVLHVPLRVDIVKDRRPLPPPPPPPPLDVPEYVPPPSFVPPPEVRVKPPPAPPPVITTTHVPPPPAPLNIAPPPAPLAPVVVKLPSPTPPPPAPKPMPLPDLSMPARIDVAHCERPQYPPSAAREEATGTTRIRFKVDGNGRVMAAEVVRRSGSSRAHRQLDRAAVQALGNCRFEPGRDRQGQPIGGFANVEYVWNLD